MYREFGLKNVAVDVALVPVIFAHPRFRNLFEAKTVRHTVEHGIARSAEQVGSALSGHVILGQGYRSSHPYLAGNFMIF